MSALLIVNRHPTMVLEVEPCGQWARATGSPNGARFRNTSALVIEGGTFNGGTFWGGTFNGGTFEGGTFEGGTFWRGTFEGGTFNGGTFWGGTFEGGTFWRGTFNGGTFNGGTFNGGTFWGGTFWGGTFRGGTFDGGTFNGGTFRGGTFTRAICTQAGDWLVTYNWGDTGPALAAGCQYVSFPEARRMLAEGVFPVCLAEGILVIDHLEAMAKLHGVWEDMA